MKGPQLIRAEVISIGDEMTSGQRLDTNGRWISQKLCDLGVEVAFHSTVGDVLADNVEVFRIAGQRADLVVVTGGLGPTQDDLTREALAATSETELEFHEETLDHILGIYAKFNREMPERNRVQAFFPSGSLVIPNPEGTAPGIDLTWQASTQSQTRFFCLPGVPAEMYTMFEQYVGPAIRAMTGSEEIIHHHVLHSFGLGESGVEELLGDLTERGRDPRVGITASRGTISLRISTSGLAPEDCLRKMQPTLEVIHSKLGDLIYGQNNVPLARVVLEMLSDAEETITISDCGLGGAVAWALYDAANDFDTEESARLAVFKSSIKGSTVQQMPDGVDAADMLSLAERAREKFGASIGIAIGEIDESAEPPTYPLVIQSNSWKVEADMTYAGHSDYRHLRSVKQVINALRLALLAQQ